MDCTFFVLSLESYQKLFQESKCLILRLSNCVTTQLFLINPISFVITRRRKAGVLSTDALSLQRAEVRLINNTDITFGSWRKGKTCV